MIDRVVEKLGRRLCEVPVGFKWFVPGLFDGSCCFGGEESAGASFLRHDGSVWTTDKDGPIMDLLAAEITARTGRDPGEHYRDADRAVRRTVLHAHRRTGDAEQKARLERAVAGGGQGVEFGRRADHRQAEPRPRQQRSDRRSQGGRPKRLVRGPAVRHRGRLQDLRGKLQGRGAPGRHRQRGSGDGECCAGSPTEPAGAGKRHE